MYRFPRIVLLACLILGLTLPALAVAEPNVAGLWQGSLYGSSLSAEVEQDEHAVKARVVVNAITGETNVYHVVGAIFNGHIYMLHGSGHVFEGDAKGNEMVGVLTTKGGSKVELRAVRAQ
jgi:hypothetical protein